MDNDIQQLPFNRVNTVELNRLHDDIECLDINQLNSKADNNINDKFDHTFFSKIDPDVNISNEIACSYYNETSFNNEFINLDNLSFIHINIRSIPKNYKKL